MNLPNKKKNTFPPRCPQEKPQKKRNEKFAGEIELRD